MWPGFPTSPPKPKTIGVPIYPPSGQMPPIITISSNPMPHEGFKLVLDECHKWGVPEPDKCTCDIMMLMAVGCKCGQFQREQNKK